MLNIDENKLKLLLLNRKNKLESSKYNGIGEIISSISLMATLSLGDFNLITFMKPLYFKIVAWTFAFVILFYGIYLFIKSFIGYYSINNLYSEISDIDPNVEHPFNIILMKNNQKSGKYLVFKSHRWGCWLFPNYRCLSNCFNQEDEISHIKECLKRDLNIKYFSVEYIGNKISRKYSIPDKIEKKYNFHYFVISDVKLQFNDEHSFRFNGRKYTWKTIDKMYQSKNIVKKNKDVLDYVREKCEIC